jgi:diguanylate cyclase (GGDEF)-like protein
MSQYPKSNNKLPRILTPIETWSLGFSGYLLSIISAPLGFKLIGFSFVYVAIPLIFFASISCFQVLVLSQKYSDISGGLPSFIYRLFPKNPFFSTYIALGWFVGWIVVFTAHGIIIADLLTSIFSTQGLDQYRLSFVFIFSIIAFLIGFSSTRALSVLNFIFVLPAIVIVLFVSIYGIIWIINNPSSPGFIPAVLPYISAKKWIVTTCFATYNILTLETVAVFTAESRDVKKTLQFLPISAFLITILFFVCAFVLMILETQISGGNTFEVLKSISGILFGEKWLIIPILLVTLCCLLSSASAVVIVPRVLFQLSKDGLLHKSLSRLSITGSITNSLFFCLFFVLITIIFYNNLNTIIYAAGFGYLACYAALNIGIWKNRKSFSSAILPRTSLILGIFYSFLIVFGGFLTSFKLLFLGFMLPLIPIIFNKLILLFPKKIFKIKHIKPFSNENFIFNQVITSIFIVFVTVSVTGFSLLIFTDLNRFDILYTHTLVFVVVSFCSVAISSWIALPQIDLLNNVKIELEKANISMKNEIGRRIKLEKTLQKNIRIDSLTGLGNRFKMEEVLNKKILQNGISKYKYALMYLDLDRFKIVNDSLGHETGDKLLVEVAQRLLKIVGNKGDVMRIGGDEFVIFVDNTKASTDIINIAEKILIGFIEPFQLKNKNISTSTSIGLVFGSPQYKTVEDIIRDADVAMYESKRGGRNKYNIFTELMYKKASENHLMEEKIRAAINNNGLFLEYQPIIDLNSSEVAGYEGLIRFKDSDGNIIKPDRFIEIAEDSGLITNINWWVLEHVIMKLENWSKYDFFISVNIGNRILMMTDLKDRLQFLIRKYNINPSKLHFEILESAVMNNLSIVKKNLQIIHDFGIPLSVDDFGTGYSNLSRLHDMPISSIKIDRSFVINMKLKGMEIIITISKLAKIFNLKTIIEGVETSEELEIIKGIEVDMVQGFYFSKPLGETEVINFYKKNRIKLKQLI